MINFGIVYGITAFGLSRRLNHAISPGEAQQVIDDYKARFVGIDQFLAACVQEARDTGYVRTILGRRRPIEGIDQRNPMLRQRAERYAINTVVQGSAADLIKVAMVDVHRRLPEAFLEARLLLQIHDELVLECPSGQAEALRDFVVRKRWRGPCPIWTCRLRPDPRLGPPGLRPNKASEPPEPPSRLDTTA